MNEIIFKLQAESFAIEIYEKLKQQDKLLRIGGILNEYKFI